MQSVLAVASHEAHADVDDARIACLGRQLTPIWRRKALHIAIPMILRALAAPLVPEADRSSPLVPR